MWQEHVLDVAAPRSESFADAVQEHLAGRAHDGGDVLAGIEEQEVEHSGRRRVCRTRQWQQPRDAGNPQVARQRKRGDESCDGGSEQPPPFRGRENERVRRIGGSRQRRPERGVQRAGHIEEPVRKRRGRHRHDSHQDERYEHEADDRDRDQIHPDPRERDAVEPRQRGGREHQGHRNLYTQGLRESSAGSGVRRRCQDDRAHRGERQPESRSEHCERIERQHEDQRHGEGLHGRCMSEHRTRRVPRAEHEERALCRDREAGEQRVGRGRGETQRGGKRLARNARCDRHQSPQPARGGDRQQREQRDVQPGDRDQVRRARGVEHAPLLARHATGVADRKRRDQRGGIAVVNPCGDALDDAPAQLGQRRDSARKPCVHARADHACECVDALAKELPFAVRAVRIAACLRRVDRDEELPPVPGTRALGVIRPGDAHALRWHRLRCKHPYGRIEAPADLVGDRDGGDRRLDERALASGPRRPSARKLVARVQSRGDERKRSEDERGGKRRHEPQPDETHHEQQREARPERRERGQREQRERAHERRRR
jgi:hypothetical protein